MQKEKYIYYGKEAEVKVLKYVYPENMAIIAKVEYEDGYQDNIVLTVNPTGSMLEKDQVVVKDYSEGKIYGYVDFLVENGFIEPEVQYQIPSGFVMLSVYKATEKALRQQKRDIAEVDAKAKSKSS